MGWKADRIGEIQSCTEGCVFYDVTITCIQVKTLSTLHGAVYEGVLILIKPTEIHRS